MTVIPPWNTLDENGWGLTVEWGHRESYDRLLKVANKKGYKVFGDT